MEQTIIVSLNFKIINPNKYFVQAFNEKQHILCDQKPNGYIVQSFIHATTHQYIEKTTNVETSIKWAIDKLKNIYPYVIVYKSNVKYVKKFSK